MEEKEKQQRKKRAANGERDSKMMAFRLDGDLVDWLSKIANKGRLINDLLRREKVHQLTIWTDPEEQPDHRYDYEP